nr:immunoglobulin light chain junction region [Macaca mulatta]
CQVWDSTREHALF